MSAALQLAPSAVGPARAWKITGCSCAHGSVYGLELSTDDETADTHVELDVDLYDNPPYLTVWSAKVRSVSFVFGDPLTRDQAVEWVKRNEEAVNTAVLAAHAYESASELHGARR